MNRAIYIWIFKFVVVANIVSTAVVYARDLGQRAQIFKVEEQGFQEMMLERLAGIDFEQEKEKMQAQAIDKIQNPKPVAGIKRAQQHRQWHHDPTYILEEDVVLPCGKVLYKAGVRVNPLEKMDLERRIFFIDARDEEQIAWLKENIVAVMSGEDDASEKSASEQGTSNEREKQIIQDMVVLVGGSPIEQTEELGMPVYFDQNDGILTSKWHIKAVPAIVEQDGNLLKITEIKI